MKFQLLDKIDLKKLRLVFIIILVFSFIMGGVFGEVIFVFLGAISLIAFVFLNYQIDKRSEGKKSNDWKTTEIEKIPKFVRNFFLRRFAENKGNIFQLDTVLYIAFFSRENKFGVTEIISKQYFEEIYLTKRSLESKTITINGEDYYYELIVLYNIVIAPRTIHFKYVD